MVPENYQTPWRTGEVFKPSKSRSEDKHIRVGNTLERDVQKGGERKNFFAKGEERNSRRSRGGGPLPGSSG